MQEKLCKWMDVEEAQFAQVYEATALISMLRVQQYRRVS